MRRIDPTGMWDVDVHLYKDRSVHGYGLAIVKKREAKELYRFDIRAEGAGGRQERYNPQTDSWTTVENPQLKKTHGCLRAYDTDMVTFQETTNALQRADVLETPGRVTAKNDLKRIVEPTGNNLIEVRVRYEVSQQEVNHWLKYIDNLLNNLTNR